MQRKKAVMDERSAGEPSDCGLLLVLTGNGKGKRSSAFGMLARALGHDMQCGVVQFIQGSNSPGEVMLCRRLPEPVRYHVLREGGNRAPQGPQRERAAVVAGGAVSQAMR
ncbi:cob(I)yrinic acid a,c-diamide adenosyltransferase, partial [Pseudomonas syringae]